MIIPKSLRSGVGVSLLCGVAMALQAQNPVTFQIDMTAQSPTSVFVRGSFNDWGNSQPAWALTNNGSGIWSGTFDDTNAPGVVEACKFFYQPGDVWENDPNRQFVLQNGGQTLPLTTFNANDWPTPLNNVTFQVDMSHQVNQSAFDPNTGYVRVSGGFNGWGESIDFTNNPAAIDSATNIYSQTLQIAGFPGATPGNYKFRAPIGDTWETISDRPSFTLTGGDQTLPLVYWNNISPFTPTNPVTFQVDMTAQILTSAWTPGQPIRVAGAMTGWGDGVDLTNNPALSGNASNVYSQILPVVGNVGSTIEYKFRANFGWESPTSTGGNNRQFEIAGGAQVLPLVFYNDASVCDILQQDTTVTFVLHLTNGTTATDGTVYNGGQGVYINGEFNGWAPWDIFLPQMVNNPIGSDYYEYTTLIPAGRTLAQKFKLSIGGADNEAGFGADHVQYIRTYANTYTMPAAEFGTNYASVRVEQSFGNLAIAAPSGGSLPITWLGRPCVTLQTKADLNTGLWTDLPATDSAQSTNWPNTGTKFFRLQKRSSP